MCENDLKKILENHLHWLREDYEGWENMRANLRGADMRGADLTGANLCDADMRGADLTGANLRGADLTGANLCDANMRDANLCDANLCDANLCDANLCGADLTGANLCDANLCGADLTGANLCDAENLIVPLTCPDTGSFIAYKKAKNGLIVKLQVPEDARRSSATGRKCRCDKAIVLEIQNSDGSKSDVTSVQSRFNPGFVYTVGEIVKEQNFCEDRFQECAPGIHFFITREEAVKYI